MEPTHTTSPPPGPPDRPGLAAIRAAVGDVASGEPRVLAVYLFGSRARGEEMEGSDVDLAVLFGEPVGVWEVLGLEDRVERALGVPVDLVDVARASAFLALDAIRGERIYCTDSTRCDEFDLYVLRRAGDLAPYEKERRRMVLGFDPERRRSEEDRR